MTINKLIEDLKKDCCAVFDDKDPISPDPVCPQESGFVCGWCKTTIKFHETLKSNYIILPKGWAEENAVCGACLEKSESCVCDENADFFLPLEAFPKPLRGQKEDE